MFRATLFLAFLSWLAAYSTDALACTPHEPQYLVPVGLITDLSRPMARDGAIFFSGRPREPAPSGQSWYSIAVKDVATGEFVSGSLEAFDAYGTEVLAWLPQQPLAANVAYELTVEPLATAIAPRSAAVTVIDLRTRFTTADELASLPELVIEGTPRVSFRIRNALPSACTGPCGIVKHPCEPTPMLMAHVELPSITGGAGAHGYEVEVKVRHGSTSWAPKGYERKYAVLVEEGQPELWGSEPMEIPEPVELCLDFTARDLATHSAATTVCLDRQTVAAAIRERDAAAEDDAPATPPPSCAASPHPAGSGWFAVLTLALALCARALRKR